jgi:hypothetical protein
MIKLIFEQLFNDEYPVGLSSLGIKNKPEKTIKHLDLNHDMLQMYNSSLFNKQC